MGDSKMVVAKPGPFFPLCLEERVESMLCLSDSKLTMAFDAHGAYPPVGSRDIRNCQSGCTMYSSQISRLIGGSLYHHRRRLLVVKLLQEVLDRANVSLIVRLRQFVVRVFEPDNDYILQMF